MVLSDGGPVKQSHLKTPQSVNDAINLQIQPHSEKSPLDCVRKVLIPCCHFNYPLHNTLMRRTHEYTVTPIRVACPAERKHRQGSQLSSLNVRQLLADKDHSWYQPTLESNDIKITDYLTFFLHTN